jgi:hypothetical protein
VGGKHLTEDTRELRIAVPDEEPQVFGPFLQVHDEVAGLLDDPCSSRIRRGADDVNGPGDVIDKEQSVDPPRPSRQQSRQRGPENPIRIVEVRSGHLTTQHRDLMPQRDHGLDQTQLPHPGALADRWLTLTTRDTYTDTPRAMVNGLLPPTREDE